MLVGGSLVFVLGLRLWLCVVVWCCVVLWFMCVVLCGSVGKELGVVSPVWVLGSPVFASGPPLLVLGSPVFCFECGVVWFWVEFSLIFHRVFWFRVWMCFFLSLYVLDDFCDLPE